MKKSSVVSTFRNLLYSLAILIIIAINGNAFGEPIAAKIQYINSHRQIEAEKYGTWDRTPYDNPVRSIHAALLHTGKVLLVAGSGNDQKQFDNKTFRTVLWDPSNDTFKEIYTPWDVFCAGHAFLPNGDLLIAGGTEGYEDLRKSPKQEYSGLKDSYIFNVKEERYEKVGDLNYARWYPTLVGLENGSILASSGLDEKGEILYGHTEIYDIEEKKWKTQPQLNRYFPTYPALFLTNDGRLFYTGSNAGYGSATEGRTPGIWDLKDNTFAVVPGMKDAQYLETSASVLLPPAQDQKFMVLGGGGIGDSPVATSRTAIADLKKQKPSFVSGPSLGQPTRYPGVVILPDDTLLQTGGSSGYRADDILTASIYNPKTNKFTRAASPTIGRNYHSEALLLPDGRVATFGSNPLEDNSFEMGIEIYSPAYLYKGQRPVIKGGNTNLQRGATMEFTTSRPADIATAKLVRPSAVTHVTDIEQRSIALNMTKTANGISISVPESKGLAPSGWYMLFVTDKKNIPSEAFWVYLP